MDERTKYYHLRMLCTARKRTFLWIVKLVMNQAPINCVGYLPVLLKFLEASYWGLMMFELSLITWTGWIKKWWLKKTRQNLNQNFYWKWIFQFVFSLINIWNGKQLMVHKLIYFFLRKTVSKDAFQICCFISKKKKSQTTVLLKWKNTFWYYWPLPQNSIRICPIAAASASAFNGAHSTTEKQGGNWK